MSAYYNDHDPRACATLKELMAAGEIPAGVVDCRSIKDVRASELRGFCQVHFFAGVGVWPHALRRAGWPDWRPIGTGSCPCQPFSLAGDQNGFEDPRHLWPDWRRIIRDARAEGQPWADRILGEQVASANLWLDLVQSDLEADGYAFGSPDLAAAGFGGAHIRQRFMWVADADDAEWWADHAPGHVGDGPQTRRIESHRVLADRRAAGGVEHAYLQHKQPTRDGTGLRNPGGADAPYRLGSPSRPGLEGCPGRHLGRQCETAERAGGVGRLSDAQGVGWFQERPDAGWGAIGVPAQGWTPGLARSGDVDWLFCRDATWRPVEPGTFPLAFEAPERVGRLHGLGNAIDAETLVQFIESYMDARPAWTVDDLI